MSLYLPNLDLRIVTFFFFSSRRRHTRSDRDWSSDVCSSDLELRRLGCREGLYLATAEPTQLTGDPLRRRPAVGVVGRVRRSEERRVGEEGRSRGAPYHLKKKKIDMLYTGLSEGSCKETVQEY